MAPTSRRLFTAAGEPHRGRWRALAEATGCGLLILFPMAVISPEGPPLSGPFAVLVGAAVLALVTVRRRYPATSLLGVAALMSVLPAAGLPAAVTAYTVAKQLEPSRRRTAVLLTSATLVTVLTALVAPVLEVGSASYGLTYGAVLAATTLIMPGLVGTAHGQQGRLLRALGDRAAAAEEARRLVDSESRLHERSRIAAEMHDLVGHRLSLISLHAGGLEMALQQKSPELRDEAAVVRQTTGDAMRELREVLGVLGPLGRDTGTEALTDATGTRSDIEALAEESRRVGIPVDLTWEGPDLDVRAAVVRRAVHRVVRESLTNVHRYAAGAHVTLTLTHTDDRVTLLVRNGVPPVPPEAATGLGSGRGLAGLRERVGLLGGTLTAEATPVGGFAVTAEVPADPEPDQGATRADTGTAPNQPPHAPPATGPFPNFQRWAVNALIGTLGLAGVGVVMMLGIVLVEQARPGQAPPVPDEPRIGMSREEVEYAVHGDDPAVRAAATGREPEYPESVTDCIYPSARWHDIEPVLPGVPAVSPRLPHATPRLPQSAALPWEQVGPALYPVTRYCFRGDTLTTIDRFTVPMVSRTPPWEVP